MSGGRPAGGTWAAFGVVALWIVLWSVWALEQREVLLLVDIGELSLLEAIAWPAVFQGSVTMGLSLGMRVGLAFSGVVWIWVGRPRDVARGVILGAGVLPAAIAFASVSLVSAMFLINLGAGRLPDVALRWFVGVPWRFGRITLAAGAFSAAVVLVHLCMAAAPGTAGRVRLGVGRVVLALAPVAAAVVGAVGVIGALAYPLGPLSQLAIACMALLLAGVVAMVLPERAGRAILVGATLLALGSPVVLELATVGVHDLPDALSFVWDLDLYFLIALLGAWILADVIWERRVAVAEVPVSPPS